MGVDLDLVKGGTVVDCFVGLVAEMVEVKRMVVDGDCDWSSVFVEGLL